MMLKPKTYEEVQAFLRDGGRERKVARMAPDAPLYVEDGSDEDEEYYVLTDAGADFVAANNCDGK